MERTGWVRFAVREEREERREQERGGGGGEGFSKWEEEVWGKERVVCEGEKSLE